MEKAYCTRSLDDLVESLGNAKGKAVVLMGAGCSVSAGIPSATGVVQEIKKHFPRAYARAEKVLKKDKEEVDYNTAMAELSPFQRKTLLNGFMDKAKAKVNWAHLALAQLLKKEHIQRVLTVNFDPLLIQACGLADFYPAVYDLTTISEYDEKKVADNSILYLNGQHTGFVMLNDEVELKEHEGRLRQVVSGIGTNVIWIVVGYSGECDPLLKVLAEQRRFEADLYWLGFGEKPSDALQKSGLLNEGRHAFYIGSQDADKALTILAQKLRCFPPDILSEPFQFIKSLVERIEPQSGGPEGIQTLGALHERLEQAKNAEINSLSNVRTQMLAGQYQNVIQWFEELKSSKNPTPEELNLGSLAYMNDGNSFAVEAQALNQQGNLSEAQNKWEQAGNRYAQSLVINPNMHEAAFAWGNALAHEARALNGKADFIYTLNKWKQAGEQYAQALDINPYMHNAAFNWGIALSDEAKALNKKGDLPAAQAKWQQAGERYAQTLEIKPDMYEAAHNWGFTLGEEAKALNENGDLPAAQAKWQKAGERYAQFLKIKPDKHEAAFNWGFTLGEEARALNEKGDLPAAQVKWKQEGERYAQALAIKPDKHEAAHNWGCILGEEAKALNENGNLPAAQAKWAQAGERFAQALAIKPNNHESAYDWAEILEDEAKALEQHGDVPAAQAKRTQARELLDKHPPKANPA